MGSTAVPGLAAPAPPGFRWTWLAWTTAGEAAGFCVPAFVAAMTANRATVVTLPSLLLAGAAEGALLGAAQAQALRRAIPDLPARRWVIVTSLAAMVSWLIGLLPSTLGDRLGGLPVPALAVAATVGAGVLLVSIGMAQWTVLRHHLRHAGRWIIITALGWLAGLVAFMLIASPLWHEGQAAAVTIATGVVAGLAMAATMAAVTGFGMERLLADQETGVGALRRPR